MKAILLFSFLIVCSVIVFAVPTIVAPFADYGGYSMFDAGQAVLLCVVLATVIGFFVYRNKEEGSFLLQLFGWALLVRMLVATGIFIFNTQEFLAATLLRTTFTATPR